MITLTYEQTLHDISDAIIHDVYEGFKNDYLCIHSLIRKYRPASIFEVATNVGGGLNVLCNAIYKYEPNATVYSLDLPYETMRMSSAQYPIGANGEDRVGSEARFPYIQLRGDSMTFDFVKYPVECAYVDSEHDFQHPYREATEFLTMGTRLVIFHDSNITEVWNAILMAYDNFGNHYDLHRVDGTRISYLLKKST